MKTIDVGKRKDKVDDEDFGFLSKFKWYLMTSKTKHTVRFYAVCCDRFNKQRFMHRMILSPKDGMDIDHFDGDGLNNCKSNLRICTRSQNIAHAKKPGHGKSSKFKGVSWHTKGHVFMAQIKINQKSIHLGSFTNEEDAARAYDKKAKELFGDFAFVNLR